jgi:asparagine synthase (glutamine-hydrolysing)
VLFRSVRCRLRANRPLAAEVSGGLDSSSVACEAEGLRRAGVVQGPPLTLVRAAFPGLPCDETVYSQAVADHLGLPIHTGYPLDDLDLCRPAPPLPDHHFDPTLRMVLPLLQETARRGIRVTLSGVGGDQLMRFTGHEGIHQLLRGRVWDAAVEAGLARAPLSAKAWRGLLADTVKVLAPPRLVRALRHARRRPRAWPWLTPAMCEAANEHVALVERRASAVHADPLERALRDDLVHAGSTPYALALCDRVAASFGQECRYPFLDVRVVEYLLAIPNEQRFYRGLPKPVLRRAMAGALPALVRERPDKADFGYYLERGFWEPHAAAVRELLRRSRLEEIGIVDGGKVRRELDATDPDVGGLATLTAMELWLRQVTSPAPKAAVFQPEASEEQHGCAG